MRANAVRFQRVAVPTCRGSSRVQHAAATVKDSAVPAYEIVLRRPDTRDEIRFHNHQPVEVGDVVTLNGGPRLVIEKMPPLQLRRIERLVCVPRKVRHR